MRALIRAVGFSFIGLGVIVLASSVSAQGSGTYGGNGGGNIDTDAGGAGGDYFTSVGRSGPSSPGLGSGADPCSYSRLDYTQLQISLGALVGGGNFNLELITTPEDAVDGQFDHDWVIFTCPNAAGFVGYLDWFQLGDPPPTAAMLENARRALTIPLPEPSLSPDAADFQIVGLETWVWVDDVAASDQSATACIPAAPPYYACASIDAAFDDVAFDMGDGSAEFACDGPGLAYDVSLPYDAQAELEHCGHVYTEVPPDGAETYDVTATTFWNVSWTCTYDADLDGVQDSSCGGGALDAAGRSGAAVPIEVREYQAVATLD